MLRSVNSRCVQVRYHESHSVPSSNQLTVKNSFAFNGTSKPNLIPGVCLSFGNKKACVGKTNSGNADVEMKQKGGAGQGQCGAESSCLEQQNAWVAATGLYKAF